MNIEPRAILVEANELFFEFVPDRKTRCNACSFGIHDCITCNDTYIQALCEKGGYYKEIR